MTRTGFVHQALCYEADEEFLAGTLDFVREGLAADDAVLAVVGRDNIGLLRDALGGAEQEIDYADAHDWYGFPSRTLGRYHAYCTEHGRGGTRGVRVIGEPVWTGRTPFETREWIRYESLVNVAFADSGHRILCPYDTRAVPADVLAGIRRTHPELAIGSGGQRPSGRYADPADFVAACDGFGSGPEAPAGSVREVGFRRAESVAARLAAAEFARRGGLDEERARDMAAAVHEVAVNAVRFGGGGGVLRLWQDADWVVCEVADAGGGAGAVPVEDAGFVGHVPPDPCAAAGHGLWVVRQLSDLVTERISARGTVVRLYFRR
ncbi:anti-sigma factor RsbA family regulatory protein [Streptomyces sp. NPDC087300]|uniref:anti-sigma factor RsbA family regulatory protein n=1 Tax=Streptomyces sp. NPDC087300 TaxID=3365780 RepID=UPI003822B991